MRSAYRRQQLHLAYQYHKQITFTLVIKVVDVRIDPRVSDTLISGYLSLHRGIYLWERIVLV